MSAAPAASSRLQRDIHRLLTTVMQREIDDPLLFDLAITRLELAHGSHVVSVYVHRSGHDIDHADIVRRLNRISPHLEYQIKQALARRRLPGLRFFWDDAFDATSKVLDILHGLKSP
ncbi:MAG: 30S ribosome-binding factor RbfA [Mariprofundaceae bacterium]